MYEPSHPPQVKLGINVLHFIRKLKTKCVCMYLKENLYSYNAPAHMWYPIHIDGQKG